MSLFDRFADATARVVARPVAFAVSAALIVGWLALGPEMGWTSQLYHLLLNSPTTAASFLLLVLLHNTQHRFEQAQNERWEALLDHLGIADPSDDPGQQPAKEDS